MPVFHRSRACLLLMVLALAGPASGQIAPRLDTRDIETFLLTGHYAIGAPSSFTFTPNGRLLFLRTVSSRSYHERLYELDPETGEERLLINAADLSALPVKNRAEESSPRDSLRGISRYVATPDGNTLMLDCSGALFVARRSGDGFVPTALRIHSTERAMITDDGRTVVFVREGQLWRADAETGRQAALTPPGSETLEYGKADAISDEEFIRKEGFWVSPDSKSVAYQQTDTSRVTTMHLANPIDPSQPPRVLRYARVGEANPAIRIFVRPLAGDGPAVECTWDHEAYPYLTHVSWTGNAPLTLTVMNRAQTVAVAYYWDGDKLIELAREEDKDWVNAARVPAWLPSGKGFLWISESTGEPRLELRPAPTTRQEPGQGPGPGPVSGQGSSADTTVAAGPVRQWISPPGLQLARQSPLVSIDEAAGAVYVHANPDNPTEQHLYRLSLQPDADPAPAEKLTQGVGVHEIVTAPAGGRFIDRHAPLSGPAVFTVRDARGNALAEVKSMAETARHEPEPVLTTVRTAAGHQLHAALIHPKGFQREGAGGRKYPVILSVYGGPQFNMVRANGHEYFMEQWLADTVGAVVVMIDGRGTPGRGRDWERAIKDALLDVPVKDQVEGLKALLAAHPELDGGRVGAWGWSFGGFLAAGLAMREPGLFRASVAVAPVCDWRDYDTAYTERYLGLPATNPVAYFNASLLKYGPALKVPVLVFHGTSDDNVLFTHSARLSAEALRNRTPLELVALPGADHGLSFPAYSPVFTRTANFFRQHLAPAR